MCLARIDEFERVVKTSPEFAKAHFSLGVVLAERGQYREAADRFANALTHDPGYVQARVQLANALARTGRPEEALAEYSRALEQSPTLSDAAMGYAFTLVRLHRYQEARDRLAEGMKAHPEQPMFGHALARLLATAPDARVRDGQRAITLVEQLLKDQQTVELGETSAMALAELGQYAQAVQVQRNLMAAAEQAGIAGARERLGTKPEALRAGSNRAGRRSRKRRCRKGSSGFRAALTVAGPRVESCAVAAIAC